MLVVTVARGFDFALVAPLLSAPVQVVATLADTLIFSGPAEALGFRAEARGDWGPLGGLGGLPRALEPGDQVEGRALTITLFDAQDQVAGEIRADLPLVAGAIPFADRLDALGLRYEGSAGNDRAEGGAGADVLAGGFGDDVLFGGGGRDLLEGGGGADRLFGGDGRDRLYGGPGADVIDGGRHGDFIFGGGGNDVLRGMAGNDMIAGGGGNDRLQGGAGADLLIGGAGRNRIEGGPGVDVFLFAAGASGRRDDVTDFASGTDRLLILAETPGFTRNQVELIDRGGFTLLRHEDVRVRVFGDEVARTDLAVRDVSGRDASVLPMNAGRQAFAVEALPETFDAL